MIIIAGAGVTGFHIAYLLTREGQEVAVIEQSERAMDNVRRQLDVKTIIGSAATPRILLEAEVHRAELFIATTGSDETNMVSCFMAKEMGAGRTIARVRNPEYSGYFITPAKSPQATRRVIRPKSLGIDLFINPEIETAKEIAVVLSGLYPSPVEEFAGGRVQIREFRVQKEDMLNRPLSEIGLPPSSMVVTIVRADESKIPRGDDSLRRGDHIHVIASREAMQEVTPALDSPRSRAGKVVILGGGRVALHLARELGGSGTSVKIIEPDTVRCRELAAKLEKAVVIQGEVADRDLLIEEGVASSDALIAATESDELNILSGLVARNLGVPHTLVLVNKPEYIPLAEMVNIDTALSPLLLTSKRIARFALHGGVLSVALLGGEQIQAIEFATSSTAHVINKRIKEAGLPKEAIAGAIVRGDSVFIPPPDTTVQSGDHVIIVAPLPATPAVERLFK
ncbi:Trk system potassium transporter TrkA [Dehalococcoidia bacterium]|nr:Trk system potassium transporter TrkA [Dehalococcoidia bacterium]MCL0088333.1 Trk system potassium transporter TrkA [Dehalococcoidia bacterium]